MMGHNVRLLLLCCCCMQVLLLYGQEIHSSLKLRNNHLWRGMEVAAGLIYTGDIQLRYKDVYGGFWVGGSADGSYKEFNNFVGYRKKRLQVELWDIFNYSPDAAYNNREFFNYKARETGRFLDFRSNYTLSDQLPLKLSWNTVLFGRDRNVANTQNKYSSFVAAEYPIYKNEQITLQGRIGYSFALNPAVGERANFFSHKAGINEISLLVERNLNIADYRIPLGLWGMWNPVDNRAALQLSLQVYSF